MAFVGIGSNTGVDIRHAGRGVTGISVRGSVGADRNGRLSIRGCSWRNLRRMVANIMWLSCRRNGTCGARCKGTIMISCYRGHHWNLRGCWLWDDWGLVDWTLVNVAVTLLWLFLWLLGLLDRVNRAACTDASRRCCVSPVRLVCWVFGVVGIVCQLQQQFSCFPSLVRKLEPIILLAIVHDSSHVDDTVSDQVVLLGILVQTCDIERCGVFGIALVQKDVDLIILPAGSLSSTDICGAPLGDVSEFEEDKRILFSESLTVGEVSTLNRDNHEFTNGDLAFVWVDEWFWQGFVQVCWCVIANGGIQKALHGAGELESWLV
ncbi:hypothetical protein F5H01DRAFT_339480 [Linnemannia elongata]|nr:hypothetical protein F5H01DRAFT_339480 [Linnemannia elongata]